jgi:hypothetical protein
MFLWPEKTGAQKRSPQQEEANPKKDCQSCQNCQNGKIRRSEAEAVSGTENAPMPTWAKYASVSEDDVPEEYQNED